MLEANGRGSTFKELSREDLESFPLPEPPVREQQAIADFHCRETAKIDALLARIPEAIDHLNELRTALISAAVTGKIDVQEAGPG